jgi:hypothetical protein
MMLSEAGCCHAVTNRSFHPFLDLRNGFPRPVFPRRRSKRKTGTLEIVWLIVTSQCRPLWEAHRAATVLEYFALSGHFDSDRDDTDDVDRKTSKLSILICQVSYLLAPHQPRPFRLLRCADCWLARAMCARAKLTCL